MERTVTFRCEEAKGLAVEVVGDTVYIVDTDTEEKIEIGILGCFGAVLDMLEEAIKEITNAE